MSVREAGVYIHEEWKGMTQPVGLVLEPIVLDRFGIFPERSVKVISDLQRRLEPLFEEQINDDCIYSAVTSLKEFLKEVLNWQDGDLLKAKEFSSDNTGDEISIILEDYDEILKPDWIVPEFLGTDNKKNIQILVKELEVGTPFDQLIKKTDNKKQWEATPQQRFERLLKDTENPIGILWNGVALRLVYAPRGESSGHITFPLEPMLTVDGRPMIAALEMILGPDRLFEGVSSDLRLRNLMEKSRKEQNEVSTRLSEQVLDALWILVRGFDEAEQKAQSLGRSILGDIASQDPSHIYKGLITVLLRLVFLLYSEDEELMPIDSLYSENYSVSGLASRLRRERVEFQSAMEGRQGAWCSLLSLFRLVFDGGGPYESYLPARHGELFDPDAYPFLEGRKLKSSYKDKSFSPLLLISDDVVEKVLSKLLILDGQLLSYRSLDVEQIGSVYEGIMGFTVEEAKGSSLGVVYNPPKQKITITYVINADLLLAQPSSKRHGWLKKDAGVDLKLSSSIKKNLSKANDLKSLCEAFENKLSPHTPRGLQEGSLILQPNAERRKSGSHYTPRSLTEPIVAETFRPWLETVNYTPNAKSILTLKICDPAMGSGAFLVAICRFLAGFLVRAWERDGFPPEFDKSFDKDIYARRLIAQNCIYGVDQNSFAVSLAKLSLWLVTLSKDLPFTFIDHALKHGDSLVGLSVNEIQSERKYNQLLLVDQRNKFLNNLHLERQKIFSLDNRDDQSYDLKQKFLKDQNESIDLLSKTGDLMIAAFLNSKNSKEQQTKKEIYLEMLNDFSKENSHENESYNLNDKLIFPTGEIKPFHWDLEFPEVFNKENGGFDIFLGNPPFAGKNTISTTYPKRIFDWFKLIHKDSHGNSDLVAHFFRRCFKFLKNGGTLGLIANNTVSQGDTRSTGLRWICKNRGTIYSARKRYKWPGAASVVVSVIHILKGDYKGVKILNNQVVDNITAFLLSMGGNDDPKRLEKNINKSFQGSIVLGMGFIFDDSGLHDEDSPGISIPLGTMYRLIQENPENSQVIFPYLGGEELNASPEHKNHRFVINFEERSEECCVQKWPELMEILTKKIKPERLALKDKAAKKYWWRFVRPKTEMYQEIRKYKRILALCRVQQNWQITFVSSNSVFADSTVVIASDDDALFCLLQSRVHEIWMRFMCSTLEERLRYTNTDCFETFPILNQLLEINKNEDFDFVNYQKLKEIGKRYYEFRSNLMQEYNQGLTVIYARFNNPYEKDSKILELRKLHNLLDNAVLKAYKWEDIEIDVGFGLDYLDLNDDVEIPNSLKNTLNKDDLFFNSIDKACSFDSQLKGIIGKKGKLSWRYRISNPLNELILSRLIDLNIEFSLENTLKTKNKKSSNYSTNLNSSEIELKGQQEFQIGLDL